MCYDSPILPLICLSRIYMSNNTIMSSKFWNKIQNTLRDITPGEQINCVFFSIKNNNNTPPHKKGGTGTGGIAPFFQNTVLTHAQADGLSKNAKTKIVWQSYKLSFE